MRGAGQCFGVGGDQRILFAERRNRHLKAQKTFWRDPLAPAGAGRLALQIGLEMVGTQQVVKIGRTQLVHLRRENRVFAGDDRFGNAVGNQTDRAVARVDFREGKITRVGGEHRALECLCALARQNLTGKLDRDGLPVTQRAIDLHRFAALDEHVA